MSAEIDIFKLKFSVFGHGFEDTRNDSGDGALSQYDVINFPSIYGTIDTTGQYLWLSGTTGIKKYDLTDLSEVAQTAVTDGVSTKLFNPVGTNYGVAFQDYDIVMFDLTDDTIIKSGTMTGQIATSEKHDAVLTDNILRLVSISRSNNNSIYTIDLDTFVMTTTSVAYAVDGFVDNSKIFAYKYQEWFYQKRYMNGFLADGTLSWTIESAGTGGDAFPYVESVGWAGQGLAWLPCYKYGKWRIGGFEWSGATDFETPKPKKVFGTFSAKPQIAYTPHYALAFNNDKSLVSFRTQEGVYRTDYHDLIKVTDELYYPVAISETALACSDRVNTYIYR